MALSIQLVEPAQGVRWMRDAFGLFMRRPIAFTGMFVAFLLLALLATLVPVVGGVAMLMSLPLLSLGFMLASRSVQGGGAAHPGFFIEPLRGDPSRRRSLLALCALYALCTVFIMQLSEWIDGGSFEHLQELMAKGEAARPEMEAIVADPRLVWGLVTRFGLAALLSVPFWHAPALVHWQGQGVGQALFSSTLALWRCKGAFFMYSLAWAGVIALFGALAALLFSLFDARQMAGLIAMPAGLVFSALFYVSLLFTYESCFSGTESAALTPAR
jgi:hypothetical protein